MTEQKTSYKKPSDMTAEEKTKRLYRLRNDMLRAIEAKASAMLELEIANTGTQDNPEMIKALEKLKSLEKSSVILRQKYNIAFTNIILPMTRAFRQEQEKLAQKHEAELSQSLTPGPERTFMINGLKAKHQHEMEALKRLQAEEKRIKTEELMVGLQQTQKQIYSVFIDAITKLYQ